MVMEVSRGFCSSRTIQRVFHRLSCQQQDPSGHIVCYPIVASSMAKMAVSSRIHPDIHIPPKTTTESRCIPLGNSDFKNIKNVKQHDKQRLNRGSIMIRRGSGGTDLFFTELIRVRPIVHPPFHNLISMAMAPAAAADSKEKKRIITAAPMSISNIQETTMMALI